MRTIYNPRQIMALTQPELDRFVGSCVAMTEVDDHWWAALGSASTEAEGLCGDTCTSATLTGSPHRAASETITIMWAGGDVGEILLGQPIFLLVCDEHGDHRNEPGRLCVIRFMDEIPTITDHAAA